MERSQKMLIRVRGVLCGIAAISVFLFGRSFIFGALNESLFEHIEATIHKNASKTDSVSEYHRLVMVSGGSDNRLRQKFGLANAPELILSARREYAAYHGYGYSYFDLAEHPNIPANHGYMTKVYALQRAFDMFPNAEWFWWLDDDAILMNAHVEMFDHILGPDALESRLLSGTQYRYLLSSQEMANKCGRHRTLANYTRRTDEVHLVISMDGAGFNCGSFAIRNNEWSKDFVNAWLDEQLVELYHRYDQTILVHLLCSDDAKWRDHLGIVPLRTINSMPDGGESEKYTDGDLVVHFAGCFLPFLDCANCSECFAKYLPKAN